MLFASVCGLLSVTYNGSRVQEAGGIEVSSAVQEDFPPSLCYSMYRGQLTVNVNVSLVQVERRAPLKRIGMERIKAIQ